MSKHTTPEVWKPIPDYPGYEVSNLGRVRSWVTSSRNENDRRTKPRILKLKISADGRYRFAAYRNKKPKDISVYVAVLEAFVGPRPQGMVACHYDDDPANNRLSNLRWDTPASNIADQVRNNKTPKGERNWSAILTEKQVIEIREQYAAGKSNATLAQKFNISPKYISDITSGRSWRHAGGPLTYNADRRLRGSEKTLAKLTEGDVREIRRFHLSRQYNQRQLAKIFCVSKSLINNIVLGKAWKHISQP